MLLRTQAQQLRKAGQCVARRMAGFTLVELAIVMVISGLLLIGFLSVYQSTVYTMRQKKLNAVMAYAHDVILNVNDGAHNASPYPCPANPETPLGDPNYGLPDCSGSWAHGLIPGARASADMGTNKDMVLVGYLPDYLDTARQRPINNYAFSVSPMTGNLVDPWNNRLIYAVTYGLTQSGRVKPKNGVIAVIDENGNDTNGINKDAQFVIVSEGPDGTHSSKLPCGVAARYLEYQNCSPNGAAWTTPVRTGATFVSSLHSEVKVFDSDGNEVASNGGKKNIYFDDSIVSFTNEEAADIWSPSGTTDVVTKDAASTGKVGIGPHKLTPTQALDVEGNISADQNTRAAKICGQNGTAEDTLNGCLNPRNLYNIKCATGLYPTSVTVNSAGNVSVVCNPLNFQVGTMTCSGGTPYIRSIYSDGTVECVK